MIVGMGRREEKKAQTRARLLDAAATVFARKGLAAASLDEVAEEAGLTKGAVYSNFESKDDLIAALLEERLSARNEEIAALAEAAEGTVEARARLGGDLMVRAFEQERDALLLAIEFSVHLARNPELARRFRSRTREVRDRIGEAIERGAAEYEIELPMPKDELAAALVSIGDGLLLQHFVDPEAFPADLFGKVLAAIFRDAAPSA
jgi:AcrR family transcriptional regulator